MLFREENFVDAYADALPLIKEHHKEISKYDLALDPDVEKYEKLSEFGIYQVYTVRSDEGEELLGYAGFFVSSMAHFKSHKQAVCDLIYLKPELRKQGAGSAFINYIIKVFKTKDVDVVFFNVPDKLDWSRTLKDLSFTIHDHMYSRRLT